MINYIYTMILKSILNNKIYNSLQKIIVIFFNLPLLSVDKTILPFYTDNNCKTMVEILFKYYNFSFDSDSKFKGLITICFYAKDLFQKLQCTYEVNAMIDNYFEYIIKNEKLLNFYLNYFKDEKSIKTLLNIDYVNKVFLFKI